MQAIRSSLDRLAARRRIIAQNLANSETPGSLAQNVNFEDSLNAAMAAANPSRAAITTSTSTDLTNPNGNTSMTPSPADESDTAWEGHPRGPRMDR
jgi:flagellar basal-body rod protein FlgB